VFGRERKDLWVRRRGGAVTKVFYSLKKFKKKEGGLKRLQKRVKKVLERRLTSNLIKSSQGERGSKRNGRDPEETGEGYRAGGRKQGTSRYCYLRESMVLQGKFRI